MQQWNNGPALPPFVKESGRNASESYLGFLNHQGRGAASSYRSISRRFFRWAEEQQLSLLTVRQDHVAAFHEHLFEEAGPNMAASSLSVISRLFAHMHQESGLPSNPADGLKPKRFVPAKKVRKALQEVLNVTDEDAWLQAALVMIAPVCIGSFSLKAIRAWSQLAFSTIERIANRLRETGIWTGEQSIQCEWLDPQCEAPDLAVMMDAFVAIGEFERDENMAYRLPPEKYERLKAEQAAQDCSVTVTRTVLEEKHEIVTVREASETIEAHGATSEEEIR
jgi:hypothetical protein